MRKFFTLTDPVVPVHQPHLLFEIAAAQGADRGELLEGVGITAATLDDPDALISYEQFSALERNALRLTGDPGLGLTWGKAFRFSQAGLVGLAALSSPNLGEAFRIASQYTQQLIPGWELELRLEAGSGFLVLRETLPRGDLRPFATEAMLAGFYTLAVQALGRSFTVRGVRLAYPRPAHHALYDGLFPDVPMTFDQPVTEAEFDPSILVERMASADPAMASTLTQLVATKAARDNPVEGIAARVRHLLLDHGGKRMGVDEVARALQTSGRSLRRALHEAGTSYQEIAEKLLQARAEEWVRSGSAKVEHIAQELGFTDARSFRRAFKRWTGHSPNEFRRAPTQGERREPI